MINSAKECFMIFLLLCLFVIGSVILIPVALIATFYYILLAFIRWDIKYIDEEL